MTRNPPRIGRDETWPMIAEGLEITYYARPPELCLHISDGRGCVVMLDPFEVRQLTTHLQALITRWERAT